MSIPGNGEAEVIVSMFWGTTRLKRLLAAAAGLGRESEEVQQAAVRGKYWEELTWGPEHTGGGWREAAGRSETPENSWTGYLWDPCPAWRGMRTPSLCCLRGEVSPLHKKRCLHISVPILAVFGLF